MDDTGMIREEIGRKKLKGKTGKRAWRFEKRLEAGREEEIARKYWEEMKEIWNRGKIIGTW